MDMTSTRSTSTDIPTISGNKNTNVVALPGSVQTLIIIHAICLGGSFIFLFPLGVIALRWFNWFRVHWMLQIITMTICILGLVVACALSVMDLEYTSFDETHQVIGIVAVVVLVVQALFGYVHHQRYKKLGLRTLVSYLHLWTGRSVILLGMVNTALYVKFFSVIPQFCHSLESLSLTGAEASN